MSDDVGCREVGMADVEGVDCTRCVDRIEQRDAGKWGAAGGVDGIGGRLVFRRVNVHSSKESFEGVGRGSCWVLAVFNGDRLIDRIELDDF